MRALIAAIALVLPATGAVAQTEQAAPISAIDWLSHSLAQPAALAPGEAPVTQGIVTEPISVQPLDMPSPDGVGLLARSVTGLPADLWGSSDLDTLVRLIAGFPAEPLPAVQDQFRRVMLAELDPPLGSTLRAPLLQARIDALLARGAVEEAEALLQRAASDAPELFRRAFDVGLLTGREQSACAHMRAVPGLAPSFPVRIFCLARTGDWNAAALTLESAKALGQLSPEEDALLAQFLDPELSELLPPTARPTRPSPLTFRMLEAIGAPMPTATLPLAFAHSDLRPTAGWKPRVEAAERLARAGAIPPGVLVAIYGERAPAASGGVWDRVASVQALGRALEIGDREVISEDLPDAWDQMRAAGLALPFARAFGPALVTLEAEPADLVFRIGLLSDAYESVALDADPDDPEAAFLAAIARGEPGAPPASPLAEAVSAGFVSPAPALPDGLARPLAEGRAGEALLLALGALAPGAAADPSDIGGAIAFLRAFGLEDIARRAALQILLLERPS
ncbi:hypothetical protein [Tropicimonas sp. IMCC6043]|uniref:hypothetical protein n=1 Tax=Tropicimonas sp. IMCC6043 TaxID=2510645 RepID=UPI00101D4C1F|nr:hypothetical protein [Tropicimonas sp. IMCC6043]RYH10405.1 hypothetical protein EU800_08970 [Tropicimonas sp. IMCC6043]